MLSEKVDKEVADKFYANSSVHEPLRTQMVEYLAGVLAAHRIAAERAALLRIAKLVEPPASASETPEKRIRNILAKEILALLPTVPDPQTGEKQ